LAANGLTCDLGDVPDFFLGGCHGGKNGLEAAELKNRARIMEKRVIGVVLAENSEQIGGHSFDKRVTHALGEHFVTCKWTHRIHHSLEVFINADADTISFTVDVALLYMVDGGLRLSRVSWAYFGKKRSANLMPSELEDTAINFCGKVN
jgi:hypothetical protein